MSDTPFLDSACVSVELWKTVKSEYYVKVYYWVPATDPKKIEEERFVDLTDLISGCTKNCSLDVFIKRSEKYTINDNPDQVN